MRHALHVRVAGIAVAVMFLTLVVVALLTYQLIRVGDRQELDRILRQELEEIRLGLPDELRAAAGEDRTASPAETDLAVQRYLAVHPGSDRHLTVVQVGGRQLSTRDGPFELEQLRLSGRLPDGATGALLTVDSAQGPLRALRVPLTLSSGYLGTVLIAGPLSDERAGDALQRILLAGTAGLLLGGLLLVVAVRRALRPARQLAAAARAVDLADLPASRSRVPKPHRPDEIGQLTAEFTRMIERIDVDQQQRRELLSAISHELRTPLAVARGHLELFQTLGPGHGASGADIAAVLGHELDRLARIAEDLTAVSRGDLAGETAHDPVFAPDVMATLARRLNGLGLHGVEVDPAVAPLVLLGDEDRIAQALLNLVLNARTHTPPGTPVRVTAARDDDHIAFNVSDDGPGLPPDVLPVAFEPFVTTRSTGADRRSGLGLTVVKAVTEAQGGRVDLRSGPGGTRVVLTFPLAENGLSGHQR